MTPFRIEWTGDKYRVSIPGYSGGMVVRLSEHEAVVTEHHKEIQCLNSRIDALREFLSRKLTTCNKQEQEITRLRGELSHWTFVRFKELEASNERLMMALQGILDIGRHDMTNPKYDGYFEAARQALTQEPT